MFNWFRSSCTVDSVTREWIEHRWRWLAEQFGSEVLIDSPTVLPTSEFFPDAYDRSDDAGRRLVNRVCGYMGADPASIQLEFYTDKKQLFLVNEEGHAIGTAAGTYHQGDTHFVVRIERSQLEHPMLLVGTVAHELAHVRLLGEGRLERTSFDNEILTDLTVVFHGMGIFLANHPRHWQSDVSTWPHTDVPKPEYMTTPMYGYSLAYRSWLREELPVKWRRHLRPGIRAEFKQATRFLQQLEKNRNKAANG
jgi:hypothetical protein